MRNRKNYEVTCTIGYSETRFPRYLLIDAICGGLYFILLDVFGCDIFVIFGFPSLRGLQRTNISSTHLVLFVAKLPEFFKEKGWKNPGDIDDSPFNFALGSKQKYFEYMSSKPYYQNAFDTVMAAPYRRDEESWFNFFPVEEKLRVNGPSEVLLVDVGGGRGKDLQAFHKRFPDLPGRLILQDLGHVTATADVTNEIENQAHSFFDEQPVKGAKAYYLRNVIHDWPDKQAIEILSRLREAMSPDSLVLIHEKAMPETNIPWMAAIGDMTMMTAFASSERTKNELETLLNKAGLKLTGFWKPEGASGQQQVIMEGALQ